MLKQWRTALRGGWLALAGTLMVSSAWAAKPGELRREADQLVKEALFHEALGLNTEREQLLEQASQLAPPTPALRWAQGQVKFRDRWVSFADVPSLMNESAPLRRYQQKRGDYPDTAAGQFALAKYCAKQGLDEQARAHLVRVLEHEPDHADVRKQLGFVNLNGKWMHQDDIALAAQAAAEQRGNFERWRKKIVDLRHDLTARSSAQRAAAAKRLAAIDDPSALPAMETLLCYEVPEVAAPAIDVIAAMTAPEATMALSRLAVFARTPELRQHAGEKLSGRPFEQYVPHMLAVMSTTIEVREMRSVDANGRLVHQQVFVRENQDASNVMVRSTEYRRQYVGGGSRQFAQWQAGLDMAEQNADAARRVVAENITTLERNERIGKALANGTEQKYGADPKEWWNWWNTYNDLKFEGEKPVAVQVATRSVNVLDGIVDSGSGSDSSPPPVRRVGECFVAGTKVHTSTGLVSIEQVRVGDMVLSQHPETGELAYKPVLRSTVTPVGPLLSVEVGERDSFRCTQGHLFWVSGEGWRQARQLRSGAQLHTPSGVVTVSHVEAASAEQTYNLIVADFHTYFAGERGVLSHDLSLRQPTQAIVPGVVVK